MKIVYYTSGNIGAGRIVRGISIGNALLRKGIAADFTIISSCPFAHLADKFSINHIEIDIEHESRFTPGNYQSTQIYKLLSKLKPDIIIVDLIWFYLHNFIHELPGKKVFLCRQIDDRFFTIPIPENPISFRPESYDLVLAAELFESSIEMRQINPIVIRNRDEILSRSDALSELGLDDTKKNCLFAFNGEPGEFEEIQKKYSYLEDEGYRMVYSTNYDGGLFPAVDYFNAFDLLVCGAGYNAFWEAVYFDKEAIVEPVRRTFENQALRMTNSQDFSFEENGADQLVELLMTL